MGGFFKSSSPKIRQVPTKQTQTQTPWDPTQEPLKLGIREAGVLQQTPKVFPEFPTFTPFHPLQIEGLEGSLDVARQGAPLIGAAQDFLGRSIAGLPNEALAYLRPTAAGDFVGTSGGLLQEALAPVYENIAGTFSRGGRYGSTEQNKAMVRAAAPAILQNLQQERSNQLNAAANIANITQADLGNQMMAAQMAQPLTQAGLFAPNVIQNVGMMYDQQAQKELADQLNRYNFLQSEPDVRLDDFLNRILPISGTGGTTVGTGFQNITSPGGGGMGKAAQAIGMAANLASIFGACDYRLKDNIEDLPDDAIGKVLELKPRSYNYRNEHGFDPKPVKGFVAHEVAPVLPEAVKGEKNGHFAQMVDLNSVLALVAKATQELAEKVDRIERQLEKLDV